MTDVVTPVTTVPELLRGNAGRDPDATAFTHLSFPADAGDGGRRASLTRGELDTRCRALAATLAGACRQADRVLVLLPPGLDFLVGLIGTLYAGAVAVACPPPVDGPGDPRTERAAQIASNAEVSAVVTLARYADELAEVRGSLAPGAPWISVDTLDDQLAQGYRPVPVDAEDLALLQYTSGSTGAPKGVMVSHGNLTHQLAQMQQISGLPDGGNIVTWISPYHALGVAGHLLLSQYVGGQGVFLSPEDFVPRPVRWLRAISDTPGPVLSCAPNFAFDRCVEHVDEADRDGLDLSGWHTTLNAAERIRAQTIERFTETYAPYGFQPTTMQPGFGQTETMLFITGRHADPRPTVLDVDAAELEHGRAVAERAEAGTVPAERRLRLVGVGNAGPHCEVIVVDPSSRARLDADQVGEVWISGPIVCQGYWRRDELTAETFHATLDDDTGPYLRTGDLGFLHDGELVLCGRVKELIIIRGRNLYPQDVELTSERTHPALTGAPAAAFSVESDAGERLVIVQSVPDPDAVDIALETLAARIGAAVTAEHEVEVHEVVLVKPDGISRTVSGKVQRGQCQSRYTGGELSPLAISRRSLAHPVPAAAAPLRGMLLALDGAIRPTVVAAEIRRRLSELMGVPIDEVPVDLPLAGLGMESLRAIELRAALQGDTGVDLPMATFLRASCGQLATTICTELDNQEAAPAD